MQKITVGATIKLSFWEGYFTSWKGKQIKESAHIVYTRYIRLNRRISLEEKSSGRWLILKVLLRIIAEANTILYDKRITTHSTNWRAHIRKKTPRRTKMKLPEEQQQKRETEKERVKKKRENDSWPLRVPCSSHRSSSIPRAALLSPLRWHGVEF